MYNLLSSWGCDSPRKTIDNYINRDKTLELINADDELRYENGTLYLPVTQRKPIRGYRLDIWFSVFHIGEFAKICSNLEIPKKIIEVGNKLIDLALDWDSGESLSAFFTSMYNSVLNNELSTPNLWHEWIQHHEKAAQSNGHFNFFFRLNDAREFKEIEEMISNKLQKYSTEGTEENLHIDDLIKEYVSRGISMTEDEAYKKAVKQIRSEILEEVNAKYPKYNGGLGEEYIFFLQGEYNES